MTLAEWFKKTGIKREPFSRKNDIPLSTIHRAVSGFRVNYDNAKRISEATNGEVSIYSLISGGLEE